MVTVNVEAKYDAWARIYNQYWGATYCETNLPPFEKLLDKYHIHQEANILDLCCGTGHMAQHLIEQGYRVTGLDISNAMLQYARENAPNAQFILEDARFFNLPPTFDAVISPSGSLNHMMSIEWQRLDITNLVRAYSQAEIISTLSSVGFTDINVYDRNGNLAESDCNKFAIFTASKQANN